MSRFGVGGQNINPLAYQDSRLRTVPVIQAPRRPTTTDKKFPLWCEWRVDKDAVAPAAEGEFWKLVKYESNGDATWVQMDTGAGTPGVDDLRDQVNAQVGPSVSGFIDIDGNVVTNAGNPSGIPLETVADAAGDTLDIQIQVAADITGAPGDTNDAGISSFDDTAFVVDADGYVTLIGGGTGPAFVSLDVDFNTGPGTDPVLADGSGQISILGNIVANATNLNSPVATHSRAANAMTVEVQLGTAVTPTPADAFDAGLFCANTNQFTVDATSGMLSLKGGTTNPPVTSFTLDDTLVTTADAAGDIDIAGTVVANATNAKPLFSARTPAADDIDLQIQVSAAITGAPADTNDSGICSFDDTAFAVDANGYVTLAGGAGPAVDSINVDANTGPGTDPVLATAAGLITVGGAAVAAHSVPIETHSRAANAYNIEVQVAVDRTAAPGNTNDAGICSFDDTDFLVDADGYVTLTAAAGGGAWVFISSVTASNDATVEFTGLSSTYFTYVVIMDDVTPATDGVDLWMRTSSDNGVSFDSGASDYRYRSLYVTVAGGANANTNTSLSRFVLGGPTGSTYSWGSSSNENGSFFLKIHDPSASRYTYIMGDGAYINDSGIPVSVQPFGQRVEADIVDAIQFLFSSGNVESGTFKLYGIVPS